MSNEQESYAHLADGRPIYFFEEGTGPPFLYLHASSRNADTARGMFEKLRDRFRCISLDRAGYRRSGALNRLTTVEEQVEAIAVVHRACTAEVERDLFGALDRFDSQFNDVRIDVFEHTALVTCVYRVEFETDGQPNTGKMYLTFLLVNDGGQWKIVHEGIFPMPDK